MTIVDFTDEVQRNLDKVWDDIQGEFDKMQDYLNSKSEITGWGHLNPKEYWGQARRQWPEQGDRQVHELRPQAESKMREVFDETSLVVSEMAGNPMELKELSHAYADCKTKLAYRAPDFEAEIQQLGKHWSGLASESYSAAGSKQVAAMLSIAAAMERSADMTNLAAQTILQLWVDLNDQIIHGLTAVIRLLSDATTVDKILSLEVPVIIEAIADILDFAQEVAKTLADYMIGVGVPDQLEWRKLNNGADGLNHNQWPVIHPGQVDDLTSPGSWNPAS